MSTIRHKPEEIVSKLRQVEVLVGQLASAIVGLPRGMVWCKTTVET
ncbi:hypothetical protein [uncultured Roseibium sp.]|nr:hypothetical protein [uncultured Roseibium sp.]